MKVDNIHTASGPQTALAACNFPALRPPWVAPLTAAS